MFNLQNLFKRKNPEDTGKYDIQALQLTEELTELENKLKENLRDNETQKLLMLRYNQAVTVYAKSHSYRQYIDPLFVKIDELRNVIRKTI